MFRPLPAKVVAFHGILASEVLDVLPRYVDMHVPIAGTDATVTDLDLMLV